MYDLTNEENNITTVCVLRLTKVGNKPLYVLAASSFGTIDPLVDASFITHSYMFVHVSKDY